MPGAFFVSEMKIYSHRGNGFGPPEGSIEAFKSAVQNGFCYEADLRLLGDGEVVVFHDDKPGRVFASPRGVKPLREMTSAEFRTLKTPSVGNRPPFLKELLELMLRYPRIEALWELKAEEKLLIEKVTAYIKEKNLQRRVTVIGYPKVASHFICLKKRKILGPNCVLLDGRHPWRKSLS